MKGKGGQMMKLDEHHVPDAMLLLQAMQDTDHRLMLTATKPYAILLKDSALSDQNLLPEGLKVIRKLVKRLDDLREAAAADAAEV